MCFKRLTVVFCSAFMVFASGIDLTAAAVLPLEPNHSAKAAVIVDSHGRCIYAQNAEEKLPMASTTKIMTALVALENAADSLEVTVHPEAVGVEGSSAYLVKNERMKLSDLLYALMLQSANDAASAISIAVGGSVDKFVDMMNQKAVNLGLESTHFANPHGLYDVDHYSSAADMAKIMVEAMRNDIFADIVSTKKYTFTSESGIERTFVNHNRLLWTLDGCIGGKTGYTQKAGRCLVSATKFGDIFFVAVTLSDGNDWRDHETLHNYARSLYQTRVLADTGTEFGSILIIGGNSDSVTLVSREPLEVAVPIGSRMSVVTECRRFEFAPLLSSSSVGRAVVICDGIELFHIELYPSVDVTAAEIKKEGLFLRFVRWIVSIFGKKGK